MVATNKDQKALNNIQENIVNIIFFTAGVICILVARIPCGVAWAENILDGMGCSCISATAIAYFLDKQQKRRDLKKKSVFLNIYLRDIYDGLSMMTQRMIWFYERMEDESFDWSYSPEEYGMLKYILFASEKYPSYGLDMDGLNEKMIACADSLSLEKVETLTDEKLKVLHKMLEIIVVNSMDVLKCCEKIEDDKIMLDRENYVSIKQAEDILNKIRMAYAILYAGGIKNYGIGYKLILGALQSVRELGSFTNNFQVCLQGRINPKEL